VGQVDCFQIDGCRCWFFSHDHLEPHFHAKASGQWEVRVFFLEEPPRLEVKFEVSRIPAGLARDLQNTARIHRAALLAEWSRKVKVE
jgi:hypothetical protein